VDYRTEISNVSAPIPGVSRWETQDGILVLRVHYSADDDKNPATPEGQRWLASRLVGYPGGIKGHDWLSEMEIDFSVYRGKAVYPGFSEAVHVAGSVIIPFQGVTMLRGWDFGLTPACTFSQLVPGPRWLIFPCMETSDREGIGITRFAQEVIEYSNLTYPGFKFQDHGDPAMYQRSQVDERTCAQILKTMGVEIIPGAVGSKSRDEIVRVQLERMIDGKAMVQVCPTARFMIGGFKGGYQFRQIGQTETYLDEHEKNEYSHPHEALSYTASCIFEARNPQQREAKRFKAQGASNWLNRPGRR
jgi:hypothetical protein